MSHMHKMPFGAETQNGKVRFRLWAPKAGAISVHLSSKKLPMHRLDEGWFELLTDEAAAGTQYQFAIDQGRSVPDPASRFQPAGVHGPSEVIEPLAFRWKETNWRGRPWEEAILYELHVGTFSSEGTFAGAEEKLDHLAELGATAVELMPISSFPGKRNWGYDGVLPYAPTAVYGRPDDLKRFIDSAHSRNLMVFLDVVYNHFGPEGNYLPLYAPQFFSERHHTPWGQAINFDGPGSRTVRDYFIHNALYWLQEYRFDGLRLDAVHAIRDDSEPDFLTELAQTVHRNVGEDRHIHLVLENDRNAAHYLHPDSGIPSPLYIAQWNDDFHHAQHVLVTGESDGYYKDYSDDPIKHLGRCLAEGYAYQGEVSAYRNGAKRGEPSRDLPPLSFISFLQNHDQVGNRAFGERLVGLAEPKVLKVALAIWLLAPSPPLLFMGEEFGANTPFLFFCDFEPKLAAEVRKGRRAEFARFAQFRSAEAQEKIQDPNSEQTFLQSKLDWNSLEGPTHAAWLHLYRELVECRRKNITPRINDIQAGKASWKKLGTTALTVVWPLKDTGEIALLANFGNGRLPVASFPEGSVIFSTARDRSSLRETGSIPSHCAVWFVKS